MYVSLLQSEFWILSCLGYGVKYMDATTLTG